MLRSLYIVVLTAFASLQAVASQDIDVSDRDLSATLAPTHTFEIKELSSDAPMTGEEILFTLYAQKLPRPVLSRIFSYLDEGSLFHLCAAQLSFQRMNEETLSNYPQAAQGTAKHTRASTALIREVNARAREVPVHLVTKKHDKLLAYSTNSLTTLDQALKNSSSYCYLRLPERQDSAPALAPLALAVAQNTHWTALILPISGFNNQTVGALAYGLSHNHTLTHLDMHDNALKDEGLQRLLDALAHLPLKKLELWGTKLSSKSGSTLAGFLKNNRVLASLCVSTNALEDAGVEALAPVLAENASLKHIDLSLNGITSKGAGILALALKDNNALTELSLTFNQIDTTGAQALFEHTQRSMELDLHHNLKIDTKSSAKQADERGNVDL